LERQKTKNREGEAERGREGTYRGEKLGLRDRGKYAKERQRGEIEGRDVG
jgi:hypothetical protein